MAIDIFGLGSLFQGVASGIQGGLNYKNQKEWLEHQKQQTAWQNQFAMEQFKYQQQQNKITRQREDNAVQRRVEDLRKTGFNPLSAIDGGGAAGSTAVGGTQLNGGSSSGQAAQLSGFNELMSGVFNILQQKQNIAQSQTQQELTEEQTRTEREKQNNMRAGTDKTIRETQYYDDMSKRIQAEIDAINKENELRELRKSTEQARAFDTWQSGYNKEYDRNIAKNTTTKTGERSYYGITDGSALLQGGATAGSLVDQFLNNILRAFKGK